MKTIAAAGAALLLAGSAARGAELSRMARDLGDAARSAGLKRVAVGKLQPAKGGDDGPGAGLTERLVVALVRGGKVQAVERSLLPDLADEVSLGRTGAVAGGAKRGMRLAAVDGLVVGRYSRSSGRIRLYARVVHLETGVIVGAADAELEDDEPSADVFDVPVPILGGSFPFAEREELRDSLGARPDCTEASQRVTRLQQGVLELKARYWAYRLRLGLSGGDVTVNPGTTIPDAGTRARFYERLKELASSERLAPMSEDEMGRLSEAEGRSYALVRDCGI